MKQLLILLLLTLAHGCSGESTSAPRPATTAQQAPSATLRLPTPPATLREPHDRALYLVEHYFDDYFARTAPDTLTTATLEQAQVDYLSLFPYVSVDELGRCVSMLYDRLERQHKDLAAWSDFFDKYLYDPNSPMRNEEYYLPVLERILQSHEIDETLKQRYADRYDWVLKNRVGHPATDFSFEGADGKKQRLLQSLGSDLTLLFFNNPDCEDCIETKAMLESDETLTHAIQSGHLKVISIYPDEDLSVWRNASYPTRWVNGTDRLQITDRRLYDLKAMPTLYLLDAQGTIVAKDVDRHRLAEYLIKAPI